jgi:hypothetical protein
VSSAFLSADDLILLTGYKRPADQARWLEEHGIPFTINARGRPVVPRDMATQRKEPTLGLVA